jgi:hydroxylamine dehydrogenase
VSLSFRPVFIAVVIACGLIVSAFLINRARPRVEQHQPSASFARATGKCAECHSQQQYSVGHEYEMSRLCAAERQLPRLPQAGAGAVSLTH